MYCCKAKRTHARTHARYATQLQIWDTCIGSEQISKPESLDLKKKKTAREIE
jgi:hypothetical protein